MFNHLILHRDFFYSFTSFIFIFIFTLIIIIFHLRLGRETAVASSITGTENLIPGPQLESQNSTVSPPLLSIGGIGESGSSALEGTYVCSFPYIIIEMFFFFFDLNVR